WDDLGGHVDALVAACGTGGTLSGVGRGLRERNPKLHLVRVIPVADDGGESKLEGIAPDGPPASFMCPELGAEVHVRDGDSRAKRASSSVARQARRSPAPCSTRASCPPVRASSSSCPTPGATMSARWLVSAAIVVVAGCGGSPSRGSCSD